MTCDFPHDQDGIDPVLRARAVTDRATPEAETPAVRVRPLVWEKRGDHRWAADALHRMVYINEYAGMAEPFQLDLRGFDSEMFPTIEAAKAAAQADYTARILAALEPAPVQGWRTDMDAMPKGVAVLAALSNGWHEIITDRSEDGDYAGWYIAHGNVSLPIERTHPSSTNWERTIRAVAWMPLPPAPQEGQ